MLAIGVRCLIVCATRYGRLVGLMDGHCIMLLCFGHSLYVPMCIPTGCGDFLVIFTLLFDPLNVG